MSVLTIVENWEGNFKKTSFESVSYAKKIAEKHKTNLTVISFGSSNINELTSYGADNLINIENASCENTPNSLIAKICSKIINDHNLETIIVSNTNFGKSIAPLISEMANAGLFSNAVEQPTDTAPLTIKCKAFSGKAFARYESSYKKNIITILPNAIGEISKIEGEGKITNLNNTDIEDDNKLKIKSLDRTNEKISLTEADIVVSAGRGLKNAENWNMIEDLALELGAATACSKPVSDMGWRPHSEHVGQTGIAINPTLYIAIGISGAIQHLAGVSGSKNIVVINTDPEAPFFKAANYGIIGDAFTVVPKFINALKNHNN